MADLRERQKAEALKRMKMLHICSQPIKEFDKEGVLLVGTWRRPVLA